MVRCEMDIEYWQTRVRITQISLEVEKVLSPDYEMNKDVLVKKSFLANPFLDQTTYGLELGINNDFSWTFFFTEKNEEDALVKGFSFLSYLESQYIGLTGKVNVIPITSEQLSQRPILYELVIPRIPKPFSIITKIIQLFKSDRIGDLTFYIFWERDDSISMVPPYYDGLVKEYYKLKILISFSPFRVKDGSKLIFNSIFKGFQEFLTFGIRDLEGVRAHVKKIPSIFWKNILRGDVMIYNKDNKKTGRFFSGSWNTEIREWQRCAFVYPALVDFSFPETCTIPKANVLKSMNLEYRGVPKDDKDSIWIGQIISNGILENNHATIPISHFGKSVIIGGQMGTGKTRLLTLISNEFYKKAPHIGILYLNMGKENQQHLYKHDSVIKYGSSDLQIPYYVEGEYIDKSIQETATYIAASLGLREPVDKILKNVMKAFIKVNGSLPISLKTLFKGLRKWYKKHPYDNKFQTKILTAIENRVLSLVSDSILNKCTQLTPDSTIPQWFLDWRNGKKVFLDLSMCGPYVKLLLASSIFQMIRALTPGYETNGLQHLIVIDEAQAILEKAKSEFANSDLYIAKIQLETIFNNLLREFRSKGLGFIIVSVTPSDLFVSTTKLPSIKILFRMGEECIRRFTHMLDDHKYLMLLKTRQALVLNGNNADRFSIQTITVKTRKIKLPIIKANR